MNTRPSWFISILLGLIFPASIFQDVALQHSPLSIAAASPAIIPLIIIFAIQIPTITKLITQNKLLIRIIFLLLPFYAFLNMYYANYYNLEAYAESLFIKGAKIGILTALLVYTTLLFTNFKIPRISFWIKIGAILAFSGLLLDFLFHEALIRNWWLHYGINDQRFGFIGDDRPRGFSYESSILGLTLIITGHLAGIYMRSKKALVACIALTAFSLLVCGSKAAFLVYFISWILATSITNGRWIILTSLLIGPLSLYVAYSSIKIWWPTLDETFVTPFVLDIDQTSSVATRLTMGINAFLNVAENPLGVGLTGFIPALAEKIEISGSIGSKLIGSPLNLYEVNAYLIQSNSFAIGAKSFFLDNAVIFGIPFIVAWFYGHYILISKLRNRGDTVGIALGIALFIPLTFYVPSVSLYTVSVAYGLLIRRANTNNQQSYHNYERM